MHPSSPYIIILLTYARLSSLGLISPMYVGSLVGSLLGSVHAGTECSSLKVASLEHGPKIASSLIFVHVTHTRSLYVTVK